MPTSNSTTSILDTKDSMWIEEKEKKTKGRRVDEWSQKFKCDEEYENEVVVNHVVDALDWKGVSCVFFQSH